MMRKLSCFLFASLLLCGQAFAASYMTLEFHEPDTRPKTVLILPVQAHLSVTRVGQNEPVIAESDAWERTSRDLLVSGLKERGYEVRIARARRNRRRA